MFAKILLVIVSIAAVLFIVLVHRQERLNIANEMTQMHAEIVELETRVWDLRAQIAERTRPEVIREQMEQFDLNWTNYPTTAAPHGEEASPNQPNIEPASHSPAH